MNRKIINTFTRMLGLAVIFAGSMIPAHVESLLPTKLKVMRKMKIMKSKVMPKIVK
jgi:hypothetical protein